jgi:hypothetical protein
VALFHLESLRRLTHRLLPTPRASLVTALSVATAIFLRPGGWLFPFSFDTAIAVAALTGALLFVSRTNRWRTAAAAICLAAASLSRLEIGLVGVLALAWETRRQRQRWPALVAAPLVLAALGYAFVSWGIPVERLIQDGWMALVRPPAAFQNVYRAYAGLDRPALRLTELALAAMLLSLAGSLLAAAAMLGSRVREGRGAAGFQTAAAGILAAIAAACLFPPAAFAATLALFPPLVRLVPPAVIVAAALALVGGARRLPTEKTPSEATWIVAAVFSSRLLLAAGYVGPYDAFFLPLPLTLAAWLLLRTAERLAPSVGQGLPRLAAGALAVFLVFRVASQVKSDRSPGWTLVSTPAGSLRLREPVARTTRLVLEDLERRVPADGSLLGFPEAGFFNYVLQRKNPTDHEQFFPGHLETAAEENRILRQLEATPPDAVLVCNVLAIGESRPAFGRDYLDRLGRFLNENFKVAASYGPGGRADARVGDAQFFVTIRVPRAAPPPPTR